MNRHVSEANKGVVAGGIGGIHLGRAEMNRHVSEANKPSLATDPDSRFTLLIRLNSYLKGEPLRGQHVIGP